MNDYEVIDTDDETVVWATRRDMQYCIAGLVDPDDPEIKEYFARRRPYLRAFFAQLDNDPAGTGSPVSTSAGGDGRDEQRTAKT